MPVATRRKAQGEKLVAEPDPERTLRKKPVRKQTGVPKVAEPSTTGKTTRRKQVDTTENAPVSASSYEPPAKVRRRIVSRGKDRASGATPKQQVVNEETSSTRKLQDDDSSGQNAPTRNTKTLRRTVKSSRAGSALGSTSTQPLSPKKVKQVLRASTRPGTAAKAKAIPSKPKLVASGRTRARKREVGDENLCVPGQDEAVGIQGEETAATPIPSAVVMPDPSTMQVTTVETEPESKVVSQPTPKSKRKMSRRASGEYDARQATAYQISPSKRKKYDSESEDELNGPKTPMRRCSPGAAKRYQASVRDTIRRLGTVGIMGRYRETLCSHRKHVRLSPQRAVEPILNSNGTTEDLYSDREDVDVSFYPDENILELGNDQQNLIENIAETTPPKPMSTNTVADDNVTTTTVPEHLPNSAHISKSSGSGRSISSEPGSFDSQSTRRSSIPNPKESLNIAERPTFDVRPGNSSPEEHLVADVCETPSPSPGTSGNQTPQPETLIWENIRQDITINASDRFESEASPVAHPSSTDTSELITGKDLTSLQSHEIGFNITNNEFESGDLAGPSRRVTLNLNDFVDLAALSEMSSPRKMSLLQPEEDGQKHTSSPQQSIIEPNLKDSAAPIKSSTSKSAKVAETTIPEALPETGAYPRVPHYALSTFAYDTRRKSLPNLNPSTPARERIRPNTSDGRSMPRLTMRAAWPVCRRGSMTSTMPSTPCHLRPSTQYEYHANPNRGSPVAKVPHQIGSVTPIRGLIERRLLSTSRNNFNEQMRTIAVPSRFRLLLQSPPKRRKTTHALCRDSGEVRYSSIPTISTPCITPQDCHPRLTSRVRHEQRLDTAAASTTAWQSRTYGQTRTETIMGHCTTTTAVLSSSPERKSPPAGFHKSPVATPQERYPRLCAYTSNHELAKTVTAPGRFQTPLKTPPRRPRTVQKRDTLRKAAMTTHALRTSFTPIKSPPKLPLATPSQAAMTPHPSAPLRGVLALVEVFTLEGASASSSFIVLLHRLGAKTTRTWTEQITHVVFKDGSPKTLQRVRLKNKSVIESGTGKQIFCVNSRWVTDCDHHGVHHDESAQEYAVDVTDVPRGGKRRRKSMEPSALKNINGNVVRDPKLSIGRSPLSRSSLKGNSPLVHSVSAKDRSSIENMESTDLEISHEPVTPGGPHSHIDWDETDSPCTPAWIAAPDRLVQQTAPMNRVRKLAVKSDNAGQNRRLTFWNGKGV